MKKRTKFDGWLAAFCATRVCNALVFMTYAAALPVLANEWNMSGVQAGAVASGFQLGYAVSQLVFSSLADRISARTVYLWSMFAAGISSLVFAFFARDFASALVLHTLVGVALGGTYPTAVMIIADQFMPSSRGMAVGALIASTSCGYALSLFISGITLPIGGYRLSFFCTCLGPIVAWLLAWITLRHTLVSVPERQIGQRFSTAVLRNRRAMLLIWGYSFHNWELQGMWSWSPAFVAACMIAAGVAGGSAAGSGANIVALFHLVGLLASLSMGTLSDRLGRTQVMLALAAVSMVCSFTFGWTLGLPMAVVIAVGIIYALSSLGDSPVLSAALTEVMEPSYLGSALGFRAIVGFGAAGIAPMAFGAILDLSNPLVDGHRVYTTWGWAFSVLGLGGLGTVWAGWRYARMRAQS